MKATARKETEVIEELEEIPAEVAEKIKSGPAEFHFEQLYKLTYAAHNAVHSHLIYFRTPMEIKEVVEAGRDFCLRKNWRFMFIELAITVL